MAEWQTVEFWQGFATGIMFSVVLAAILLKVAVAAYNNGQRNAAPQREDTP